jgi:hypothetical protein
MITLDFLIKPQVVAIHLLNTYIGKGYALPGAPTAEAEALVEQAQKLDDQTCKLLSGELGPSSLVLASISSECNLTEIGKRIDKLVDALIIEPAFPVILKQTAKALADVRNEWEHNFFRSSELLAELTGLKLDRHFSVYLTHPATPQGFNDLRGNIFWTYRLDFPNYNTVYLWHEIMHYYIDREQKYSNILRHSIVELLSDVELRQRLNGGSYLPLVGHPYLQEAETKLLPSWETYVKQKSKKNINHYIAQADKLLKEDDEEDKKP